MLGRLRPSDRRNRKGSGALTCCLLYNDAFDARRLTGNMCISLRIPAIAAGEICTSDSPAACVCAPITAAISRYRALVTGVIKTYTRPDGELSHIAP